jgi:CRISPR-associated exonuclease Cas4
MHTFRDLATAAYCPRKLYYRRQDPPEETPDAVATRRDLAFAYERLLTDDEFLLESPIAATPTTYRSRLACAKASLDRWGELADPPARDVFLSGADCRGIAHKVLDDPPVPSLCFGGDPPERGVWEPQRVHAVAAAKALAWERETPVESCFVEYPAHGVVRRVNLTTGNKAAYRDALGVAAGMAGPPPRLRDDARCAPCEYRETCGVRTESLRSRLG